LTAENVSRETIALGLELHEQGIMMICTDCEFQATFQTAVREKWRLVIERGTYLCPFCLHLRAKGASAPLPYCLSSPTNLNNVGETTDEEIPF